MEDLNKLLFETKILKKDEELILLPNGVFIWNQIVSYLKDKFSNLSYSEIYTTSLETYVKNSSSLPSQYFSLTYLKDKIEFKSYGKYQTEIEEARNITIDVLEIYNQLGKDLLAIPFLSGKNPFNEDKNLLTTYFGERIIESNYLGKYDSSYLSSSKINTDILYTIINMHKDEKGLVFSPKIAPCQIVIIPLKPNEKGVLKECRKLNEELKKLGYRVFLNEDNLSSKEKKNAAIISGIPLIIEFGPRDLERNVLEVTCRDNLIQKEYEINDRLFDNIDILMKTIHKRMFKKALEKTLSSQKKVLNLGDLHNNNCKEINKVMWCGDLNCLDQVKEYTSFIPFNQQNHSSECLFCYKKAKHLISIIKK